MVTTLMQLHLFINGSVEQKGQKVVIVNQEEYDDMTQFEKYKIAVIKTFYKTQLFSQI